MVRIDPEGEEGGEQISPLALEKKSGLEICEILVNLTSTREL